MTLAHRLPPAGEPLPAISTSSTRDREQFVSSISTSGGCGKLRACRMLPAAPDQPAERARVCGNLTACGGGESLKEVHLNGQFVGRRRRPNEWLTDRQWRNIRTVTTAARPGPVMPASGRSSSVNLSSTHPTKYLFIWSAHMYELPGGTVYTRNVLPSIEFRCVVVWEHPAV